MSKGNVLVLGCGPAGLFAAYGAEQAGYDVEVFSKKRKSEMFGAQYLHQPIPEVSPDQSFQVEYRLEGTTEEYKRKVYGAGFRGTVSPEDLQEPHEGWDIRATYDTLWHRYVDKITDVDFPGEVFVNNFLKQQFMEYKFIVSTIPAPLLCQSNGHGFTAQKIWSIGDAPERGIFSPIKQPLNTVVCSGLEENSWYRAANILGYHTVEWPMNKRPPIEGLSEVVKPLAHSCNCWPEVKRMGRYGKWQKGILSHEAFYETYVGLGGVL